MSIKTGEHIHMRISKEAKLKYLHLANKMDKTLSELIRDVLNRACKREGIS